MSATAAPATPSEVQAAASLVEPARRVPSRSTWLRLVVRRPLVAGSLVVLVAAHALVFGGPLAWTVSPEVTSPLDVLLPPGPGHPLGTDELGRDELSRLLHGGQVTLVVGFAAMLASVVLGLLVGALAGFYRGWVDALLMRVTDALMAVPAFFLILAAVTVLGAGPLTLVLVIGGTSWMQVARVVYGETLRLKGLDFVVAAESLGAGRAYVLARHVLPQTMPSLIVSATLGVGFAVLTEAAVSYLGLGIQAPTPSWGNMLQNAQQYVFTAPGLAVYPGAVITCVVLAYNFLGDGLRDALDPRLR
jgi:peptide/nickel transport system permease protein